MSVSIQLPSSVVIRDLAQKIEKSPIEVIKKLMANGVMANINQQIDYDTAAIVMEEFGFEAQPIGPNQHLRLPLVVARQHRGRLGDFPRHAFNLSSCGLF